MQIYLGTGCPIRKSIYVICDHNQASYAWTAFKWLEYFVIMLVIFQTMLVPVGVDFVWSPRSSYQEFLKRGGCIFAVTPASWFPGGFIELWCATWKTFMGSDFHWIMLYISFHICCLQSRQQQNLLVPLFSHRICKTRPLNTEQLLVHIVMSYFKPHCTSYYSFF